MHPRPARLHVLLQPQAGAGGPSISGMPYLFRSAHGDGGGRDPISQRRENGQDELARSRPKGGLLFLTA